jgi:hypothetical protein
MSKPITIHAVTGGFTVEVSDTRSKAYGAKSRKVRPDGFLCREASGQLSIGRLRAPTVFDREQAVSLAHQVGRYTLGFGDFVAAYTDAPEGFWS